MALPLLAALAPGLISALGSGIGTALSISSQEDIAEEQRKQAAQQFGAQQELTKQQMKQQEEEAKKNRMMALAQAMGQAGKERSDVYQQYGANQAASLKGLADQYRSILGG